MKLPIMFPIRDPTPVATSPIALYCIRLMIPLIKPQIVNTIAIDNAAGTTGIDFNSCNVSDMAANSNLSLAALVAM